MSLAFVRGIHRSPVNPPHKGSVTREMFPFDDVIMIDEYFRVSHRWKKAEGVCPLLFFLCCSSLFEIDLKNNHFLLVKISNLFYQCLSLNVFFRAGHDDVINWKHFPRHWPFVLGSHRSPVNSWHKGQWRGALMFSLICACALICACWVNNGEAGDLRRHHTHYDVTVMYGVICENDEPQVIHYHFWHHDIKHFPHYYHWIPNIQDSNGNFDDFLVCAETSCSTNNRVACW